MPDAADFTKLDTGLVIAVRAYEDDLKQGHRDADAGISVALQFEGDLAGIEALGFETHMVSGNEALGTLRFADLPAITAHPNVQWISAGRAPRKLLDTAVRDIQARAIFPLSGAPVDGVWHVAADGTLTNVPDATGRDVIVAVIDTGIDYTHPMFMSQLTPTKRTRILRIWDQGLRPAAVADGPPVARLGSANTYGIEFDDTEIETALNGGAALAHKDCDGHGTHVAGIAAGGRLFPAGGSANLVGVAPEASIIAVKLLDTPEHIFFRLAAGFGQEVTQKARFRDAVLYCLRTARALGKPVVVNMSFGDESLPGDGLDADAVFVDGLMDPVAVAGPNNFPKGAIIVKAAGNEGDIADRLVARIVVPAGGVVPGAGVVTVPLLLTDARGGENKRWDECVKRIFKPAIGVSIWYRRAANFQSVACALRLPDQAGFSGDMTIGGFLDRGFVPRVGPPPSVAIIAPAANVHSAFVRHEGNAAVTHPSGASLRRHRMLFWVEPKVSAGTVSYHPGIYEMRITAPVGTELFVMCEQQFWGPGLFVGFGVGTALQNGTAIDPAVIDVTSEFSATDTLGQHVISVAAYDETHANNIAPFSSRGPLRDFSNPPLGVFEKPEIAAPGVDINSADGVDTEALVPRTPPFLSGIRFTEHSGTSMSAPMITGVIALMLDKKGDLNSTDVRGFLALHPRAAVSPAAPPASTRAYGKGMVDAMAAHADTH